MIQTNYNPDVLTCLANLSNDEVFTPPGLVNDMLDLLPASLWRDPNATFLDPVCKTGVFLREIAKRLMFGLESQIPDKQERINHIFSQQLYGIAITELTGLLSRRSVYCSKTANGKYSIGDTFLSEEGNIRYNRLKHSWEDSKCSYCGASQEVYDRGDDLEHYAYEFIHIDNPEDIIDMRFDVIVGNPPYQLSDGGAQASAKPLYHKFVEQAKKLNPRFLSMIIPSRWFSGGKGLDDFREDMLNDRRLIKIVDYFDSNECFPGVDISGGVCYFLWSRDEKSDCQVKTIRSGNESVMVRPLLEPGSDIFIRFNEAISIYRKIKAKNETCFNQLISSRKPFGITTSVKPRSTKKQDDLKIYSFPNDGYINPSLVLQNESWINEHKVFISYAYGERGPFPYLIIGKPFYGEPGSCCSETYLLIGPFISKEKCERIIDYMKTKIFRFLVLLRKNTQHATSKVYSFVPMQDFEETWSDEKLYEKYGFTHEESAFIDIMIRPMDLS